jgi:hypothetical protein
MGILYQLTFANGKKYIGITESEYLSRRLGQHRYLARRGSKLPIYLAWIKYGEPDAQILQRISGDALYQSEIDAIKHYCTIAPNGYNLLDGGQKSPALNKKVAEKISQATKKRFADPAQREAVSLMMKNRSAETRKKISVALTGKNLTDQTKEKIRQANLGKKVNKATRAKMSKSHTGKKYSEETLERMRIAARKRMQSPEAKAQLKTASIAGGDATKLKSKKCPTRANGWGQLNKGENRADSRGRE